MQRGAERVLHLFEAGKHEEALAMLTTDDWCPEEQEITREPVDIAARSSQVPSENEHEERGDGRGVDRDICRGNAAGFSSRALALMEGDAWGMENKKEARTDGQTFAGYLPAL
jgi:hypothetical protein